MSDQTGHIVRALARIEAALATLDRKVTTMAASLDTITATVKRTEDAEDAAIVLLQGLKAALDAAGTDPVALKALSDELGAKTDALAAAVVANTPAATPPAA